MRSETDFADNQVSRRTFRGHCTPPSKARFRRGRRIVGRSILLHQPLFCFSEISDDGVSVDNFKEVVTQNSLTSSYALRGWIWRRCRHHLLFFCRGIWAQTTRHEQRQSICACLTSDFPGALLLKTLEAVPDLLLWQESDSREIVTLLSLPGCANCQNF